MNQETPVAQAVQHVEDAKLNPALDNAIKHLLAHKPFLARIMKECLPEYKDCSLDDIMTRYIEGDPVVGQIRVHPDQTNPSLEKVRAAGKGRIAGSPTEDNSLSEGMITYDIRFNALAPKGDDLIGIIINIEAQNDMRPGYSLLRRGIYYCSRMISAQKTQDFQHSNYDDLKKVYSIWVCANAENEQSKKTITSYSMKETQVIGEVVKDPEEYDLLSIVMIRLGDVPKLMDGTVEEDALSRNVIGMLEVLLKGGLTAAQRMGILEKHYGIEMSEQMEEGVGHMCNLSKGIFESGRAEGIDIGVAKGIDIGVAKGEEKKARETAISLKKLGSMSLQQIADILGFDVPTVEKWLAAAAVN